MHTCVVIRFRSVPAERIQPRSFVINRFFMKLFNTNVMYTVKLCQDYFDFDLLAL